MKNNYTIYYNDNLINDIKTLEKYTKSNLESARDLSLEITRKIIDLATKMGFDRNLWKSYIAYTLVTDENAYTTTIERKDLEEGSSKDLVLKDLGHFFDLYHYDFGLIEEVVGIDYLTILQNYKSLEKNKNNYNQEAKEKIDSLIDDLDQAEDLEAFYQVLRAFYSKYGVGDFGLAKTFRIDDNRSIDPIKNIKDIRYDHIIGYQMQKDQIAENTRAFVEGKDANNILLYGDSGTGKSTTIKATINEFYPMGLRMIEVYKHQLESLNHIIGQIKERNYKFIIYMDDLSFEEFETDYKYLKSVIEGSLEDRPSNVLIYATSNRRNLIKETWQDKTDTEITRDLRRSDNQEEKQSLAHRFVSIQFLRPMEQGYLDIVRALAQKEGIQMDEEDLIYKAKIWERQNGGKSGRTAEQFIKHLKSK